MSDSFAVSDRTRVVREANRAVYDREAIYKILDEGFVCHVGFSAEGQPFVIPTMFARVGDAIYFHGSAASRMLRGVPVRFKDRHDPWVIMQTFPRSLHHVRRSTLKTLWQSMFDAVIAKGEFFMLVPQMGTQ